MALIVLVLVIIGSIYNRDHRLTQILFEWTPLISLFLVLICLARFKVSVYDYSPLMISLVRVVTTLAKLKLKADGCESFQFDPKGELKSIYFLYCEALFLLQVNWKTDLLISIPLLALSNSV